MSDTGIDDQLVEVQRRIDALQATAEGALDGESPRIQRRLAALQQEETTLRTALRRAPDEVDEQLAQLRTRLDVAEHSLAADVSDDWAAFAAAVTAELASWDTYLERLQTNAATQAWEARERAEAAIGDVRDRRIAVGERLAEARGAAGDGWQEQRDRVTAARDELERKAAEPSNTK